MSEAADGYREILAARPRDTHALHRMWLVSVHMDEMAEAGTYLDLALESAPDCAGLREHAGLIAAMQGEQVRAEAFYLRALELSQGDYRNGWQRRKTYYTTALARHTMVFPAFLNGMANLLPAADPCSLASRGAATKSISSGLLNGCTSRAQLLMCWLASSRPA